MVLTHHGLCLYLLAKGFRSDYEKGLHVGPLCFLHTRAIKENRLVELLAWLSQAQREKSQGRETLFLKRSSAWTMLKVILARVGEELGVMGQMGGSREDAT